MNKAEILFNKTNKTDRMMKIDFDKGDTKENAIVILGAENETDGVQFEYSILTKLFPKYTLVSQSLILDENKVYDVIKLCYKDEERVVWFEITDFFGKN